VEHTVALRWVRKIYGTRAATVTALDGVTLGFDAGTFTAVVGPVRFGQVDTPAVRRRARPAHVR
jgi:hypothetical protein